MNKIHWETTEVRHGMRAVVGWLTLPSGRKRVEYRLISSQEIEQARPAALRYHLALIVHGINGALIKAQDLEAPSFEAVRETALDVLRKRRIVW